MTTKRCPRCSFVKALSEFHPRADRPGKVQSWCKICRNAQRRRKHGRPRQRKQELDYVRAKRDRFAAIMGVNSVDSQTG